MPTCDSGVCQILGVIPAQAGIQYSVGTPSTLADATSETRRVLDSRLRGDDTEDVVRSQRTLGAMGTCP
jgi:hypothetical protein